MKLLKDNVYWVGATDWRVRYFHGYELSTHRGSTYNAYFIDDEKKTLIDGVWEPLADTFICCFKKRSGKFKEILPKRMEFQSCINRG